MVVQYLRFDDGAIQFRQRLAVSLLSHRPILIRNIRSNDVIEPGLRDYEVSFLRLLDKITNGSTIEINSTGTQVRFKPGMLLGGEHEHDCLPDDGMSNAYPREEEDITTTTNGTTVNDSISHRRSVSWFLEGILPLALFGKEPLSLRLYGITDGLSNVDPSVDYISMSFLPLLRRFLSTENTTDDKDGGEQQLSLIVQRRGAYPRGGGEVVFHCPIVKYELHPIDLLDLGKIKRIRGVAISCRISPSSPARVAYAAKGVLHRLLPDVWIHTDTHTASSTSTNSSNKALKTKKYKNNNDVLAATRNSSNYSGGGGCGPSPGLSLILVAESTTGVILCAECSLETTIATTATTTTSNSNSNSRELPEELGERGAALLLEEIRKGGCVDTTAQSLALLLMCLGPEDVTRIRLGTISQYTIASLRLFKEAFGVEFKVRADRESKTVVLSCLGSGYRNMARAST
jgi:RNA 3'-terminal phosphate cyclase-like protein